MGSHEKKIYLYAFYTPTAAHHKFVPSGMLTLSWCLKNQGYKVIFRNINTQKTIAELFPDHSDALMVCMCSICFSDYLQAARTASIYIKNSQPDVPIAWSGEIASLNATALLTESYVDVIGLGSGEEAIVGIARACEGKESLHNVPGIAFCEKNEVKNTGRARIQNLDQYDYDFESIDMNEFIHDGQLSGPFMTSRGCPNSCTFCCNARDNKEPYRGYSPEKVRSMLQRLRQHYTFDTVFPGDPNFFLQKDRAIAICNVWKQMGIRPISLDAYATDLDIDRIKAAYDCGVDFFHWT